MRVISPYVMNLVPPHSLKADPDISLDVFNQVTDVDLAIGRREG
jgi:hypothetical protein